MWKLPTRLPFPKRPKTAKRANAAGERAPMPLPDRCACGAALVDTWVRDAAGKKVALKACPVERCFRCGAPSIVRVFHLGRWLVACSPHRHSHQVLPDLKGAGGDYVLWDTPAEIRAQLEAVPRFDPHPVTVRVVAAQLAALPAGRWEPGAFDPALANSVWAEPLKGRRVWL